MKKIRGWFEDFEIVFSTDTRTMSFSDMDVLVHSMLKEEGADVLLCEVNWEEL